MSTTPTLEPVARLSRDLRKAATELGEHEARGLVDLYYQFQKERIGLGAQLRAAVQADEPHATVTHFADQFFALESQMKSALDAYSQSKPLGEWARSNMGVGPIIAAGLLAHIDISRSPTAGAIWRFAGIDPTNKWHGSAAAKELVKSAWQAEDSDAEAVYWLSRAVNRRYEDFVRACQEPVVDRDVAALAVAHYGDTSVPQIKEIFEQYPLHTDNAIRHACDELGVEARKVYAELYAQTDFNRQEITSLLARRPWNSRLKVICWHLGGSFVKFRSKESCYYGHLYELEKNRRVRKNADYGFAELAQTTLEERNIQDKETRQRYESGRLPDGRIDMQARRYAVKIFLSHYHQIGRTLAGLPVPKPFAIEHLGHAHVLEPPNWPM